MNGKKNRKITIKKKLGGGGGGVEIIVIHTFI